MKKVIALFLVLAMALSLAACSQKQEYYAEDPETVVPATEPARKTIHVLLPANEEGWEGAVKAQAQTAMDAITAYDIETRVYESYEQQCEALADIAAQSTGDGTQAVVVMPIADQEDPLFADLLEANVAYAMADVIPAAAEAASVTNVQYDQRAIGAATAAWLVQNGLTQDQKVLIIQGLSEAEAQRTEGFQRYLLGKASHDGVTIEEPWTSTENIVYSDMQGETAESAESYFTTYMEESDHAGVKYIAAWDDAYVMGILEALEGENIDDSNKAKFLEGAPFIAGCGGSQMLLDVLTGTSQFAAVPSLGGLQTVVLSTDLLKIAVETMAAYLNGEVVAQDNTQPIVWATVENASQFSGYVGENKTYEVPVEEEAEPTLEETEPVAEETEAE